MLNFLKEERRKRKIKVGEKKTPFTKFVLNKNDDDDDSIEDPDDDPPAAYQG